MYIVYILRSLRTVNFHYVGYTTDIDRRLQEHNAGRTRSLVKHRPLEVIRKEEYSTLLEARRREKQIKSYKSGEAFRCLIDIIE